MPDIRPTQGKWLSLLLGTGGVLLVTLTPAPGDLSTEAWRALGLAWLMAVFWIAETLPLAAYLSEQHGIELGFGEWMIIGLPVSLTMLTAAWLWLAHVVARGRTAGTGDAPSHRTNHGLFRQRLAELGPMTRMEKRITWVFILTAAAWIFQPLLARLLPAGALTDTSIAIACAIVLHALPAGDGSGSRLMDWESSQKLPWGVLLLFGGGLALAGIIQDSGLAQAIASGLETLDRWPTAVIVLAVTATIIFLTEITSNTATTAAFLPLLGALAIALGLPVEALVVPAAIAASCAFMLPVATPPNAIVFGSNQLSIKQMASAGLALNLIGTALVAALGTTLIHWRLFH